TTALSPRSFTASSSRCTCRMLNPNSLAASPWVISFFLVFFNATSRSLSTWVISSCPSCIPKAWGCQDDISTLLKDDILILLPQLPDGDDWRNRLFHTACSTPLVPLAAREKGQENNGPRAWEKGSKS